MITNQVYVEIHVPIQVIMSIVVLVSTLVDVMRYLIVSIGFSARWIPSLSKRYQ